MKLLRLGTLLTLLLVVSGCLGVVALGLTPYDLDGKAYWLRVEHSDDGSTFEVSTEDGRVEKRFGEPGPLFRRIESEGRKVGPTRGVTTAYENLYDDFSDGGGGH